MLDERWKDIVQKVDFALQPIVDINSGVTVAHESLLREYKRAGFDSIDDFFDTAYEKKVLFSVDIELRKKVFQKFKAIYDQNSKISLFYNIDNRIIQMDNYETGNTTSILKEYGYKENCITFEISEKHEFKSFVEAKTIFNLYKEQGYKIALDDFGTGFSGLKMLYYMSPDCIKIDRFFITDILNDNKKKIYVANIVNIAHNSNIKVLAEGVETLDELEVCREIGCDLVQGYYVQRPTQDITKLQQTYSIVSNCKSKDKIVHNSFNLDNVYYTSNNYNELIDNYIIASSANLKGEITSVSKAFCDISKYTKLELIGQPHNIVRDPSMNKEVFCKLWKTIKKGEVFKGEISNKAKDGTIYWVDATISPNYDNNGILIGYTSIRQDITDKKELEKYVITDHLTKAYNRKYFDQILEKKVTEAKSENRDITLAILDIDSFKLYNDTYGHHKGDKALQKLSKYVLTQIKQDEYFFRIGGEEFAIIMLDKNKKSSLEKLNTIIQGIEQLSIEHKKNKKVSKYLTVSCGAISIQGEELQDNTNLFISADMLLYQAKNSGKNRVVISSNKVYNSSLSVRLDNSN